MTTAKSNSKVLHNELLKIAKEEFLSAKDTKRFVKFAELWASEDKTVNFGYGYGNEWADRFRTQREYVKADGSNIERLIFIDGNNALDIFVKELINYDPGWKINDAIKYAERYIHKSNLKYNNLKRKTVRGVIKASIRK